MLGLELTQNVLWSILSLLPAAIVFIALGLICGSFLTEKQVGGFCGALLTNLSAWLSGTWFDLEITGDVFRRIAYCLPFARAVEVGRITLNSQSEPLLPHMIWLFFWAVSLGFLACVSLHTKLRQK